jgi:hypothetical protein
MGDADAAMAEPGDVGMVDDTSAEEGGVCIDLLRSPMVGADAAPDLEHAPEISFDGLLPRFGGSTIDSPRVPEDVAAATDPLLRFYRSRFAALADLLPSGGTYATTLLCFMTTLLAPCVLAVACGRHAVRRGRAGRKCGADGLLPRNMRWRRLTSDEHEAVEGCVGVLAMCASVGLLVGVPMFAYGTYYPLDAQKFAEGIEKCAFIRDTNTYVAMRRAWELYDSRVSHLSGRLGIPTRYVQASRSVSAGTHFLRQCDLQVLRARKRMEMSLLHASGRQRLDACLLEMCPYVAAYTGMCDRSQLREYPSHCGFPEDLAESIYQQEKEYILRMTADPVGGGGGA